MSQFIDEATAIFGNRYCYDKVNYINTATNVIISCNKCGAEFLQAPGSHLLGRGCPKCPVIVSKPESEWLDYIGIPEKFRQEPIKIKRTRPYIVDAYVPETNTIYEFYGDFWHGNPLRFDPKDMNKRAGKTFGELYQKVIDKENEFKNAGYNIVSIWELDWKNMKKTNEQKTVI